MKLLQSRIFIIGAAIILAFAVGILSSNIVVYSETTNGRSITDGCAALEELGPSGNGSSEKWWQDFREAKSSCVPEEQEYVEKGWPCHAQHIYSGTYSDGRQVSDEYTQQGCHLLPGPIDPFFAMNGWGVNVLFFLATFLLAGFSLRTYLKYQK